MKIIIFGEFSGVAKNIRAALLKDAPKCLTIEHHHRGDGYKSIGSTPKSFLFMGRLWPILSITLMIFRPPRILIFFSPFFIPIFPLINTLIVKILSKRIEKLIFMPCTNDAVWWDYEEQDVQIKSRQGFVDDLNGKPHRFAKSKYLKTNEFVALISDKIFPMNADYLPPYLALRKDAVYCPMPIDVDSLSVYDISKSPRSKKNYISHGITRPGLKGSKKIIRVIEMLKTADAASLEFNSFTRVSYSEFESQLSKTDIYMDQANSHSSGIAGLTALWFCPYVFSGNSKKNKSISPECPIQHAAVDDTELMDGIMEAISNIDAHSKQHIVAANRKWLRLTHWNTQLYKKLILND